MCSLQVQLTMQEHCSDSWQCTVLQGRKTAVVLLGLDAGVCERTFDKIQLAGIRGPRQMAWRVTGRWDALTTKFLIVVVLPFGAWKCYKIWMGRLESPVILEKREVMSEITQSHNVCSFIIAEWGWGEEKTDRHLPRGKYQFQLSCPL